MVRLGSCNYSSCTTPYVWLEGYRNQDYDKRILRPLFLVSRIAHCYLHFFSCLQNHDGDSIQQSRSGASNLFKLWARTTHSSLVQAGWLHQWGGFACTCARARKLGTGTTTTFSSLLIPSCNARAASRWRAAVMKGCSWELHPQCCHFSSLSSQTPRCSTGTAGSY